MIQTLTHYQNRLIQGYKQHQGHWFALGFGVGLLPKMPGTFGSLLAFPIFALFSGFSWHDYLLGCLIVCVFSCLAAQRASIHLNAYDHQAIVCDEISGMMLTLAFCPPNFLYYILAFALFRFFDILKPFPINWIDRQVKGGLGIIGDDIMAAIYAWSCLHLLIYSLHHHHLF
jgi:phosphatidylglycerophosphatase A